MLSEEQMRWRLSKITGTDAAIILGKSQYMTPVQLWKIKVGLEEQEQVENEYTLAGRYLESAVTSLFEHHTGKKVCTDPSVCQMISSKEHPILGANIDGKILEENAIFEAKTASHNRSGLWGESGSDKIPQRYLIQVLHYMYVCNADCAYVAVLISGYDFRWYKIERNKALEEQIVKKLLAFAECVQNETPPELATAADYIELHGTAHQANSELLADKEMLATAEKLATLIEQQKTIGEEINALQDKLKLYMQDKEKLVDEASNTIATYKQTNEIRRLDAKKIEALHPDVYNACIKVTPPQRRFLFKFKV